MIYSPAEDSYLIEKEVRKYSPSRKVLDMGTGSGILALAALASGAKSVFASDINREAITNLKANKKIKSVQSDLFEKIKGKFDLIVFNPPYLPDDNLEDAESKLITSGGKKGDEIILKFLSNSTKHLNKNGLILLLISSLTPTKKMKQKIKSLNMHSEIISEQKLFFETLYVLKITTDLDKNKK